MRLAYFSPLPPSKSGIADYNAELLPLLTLGAEISVFVEEEEQTHQNSADYEVYRVSDFSRLNEKGRFDLSIYHQGNNPYHEYIYDQALTHPGLVVLHEHCLHHLIAWTTLGRGDEDAYWSELFHAYGRRGAQLAEMRERDIGSEYQQFVLPLNRRLISRSLGLIVHNQFAASHLEGAQGLPIEVIPHHLSRRVHDYDDLDVQQCRRSLGISDDTLVIGTFGFVTQSKRIPVLLGAFKRLLELRPTLKCIIVGEDHWKWSVAPVIAEMGLAEHVEITGYTDEDKFFRYLKAVDIVVNLRYPTAGETSGTLIRSLGMGKAVVVSDHGQFGELPADTCLKVPPGTNEDYDLYLRLRALILRPALRQRLAERAKEWAREACGIERSAARYLSFAERIIQQRRDYRPARPLLPALDLKYQEPRLIKVDHDEALGHIRAYFDRDQNAIGYLGIHGERIVRTVELLPQGTGEESVLELSSYLQMPPLILRYGNYREVTVTNWWEGDPRVKTQAIRHSETGLELSFPMVNVDVERDRFPFEDSSFDVVLCCELIEHLVEDPMHMLLEVNRVLKWGGLVVVTTPNIASAFSIKEAMSGSSPYIYGSYNLKSRADRHSREYTPRDVRLVLESAGFKVIKLFTEDLWHETDVAFLESLDHTGVPRTLRGDNIFAVGRKLSDQVERFPELIYD